MFATRSSALNVFFAWLLKNKKLSLINQNATFTTCTGAMRHYSCGNNTTSVQSSWVVHYDMRAGCSNSLSDVIKCNELHQYECFVTLQQEWSTVLAAWRPVCVYKCVLPLRVKVLEFAYCLANTAMSPRGKTEVNYGAEKGQARTKWHRCTGIFSSYEFKHDRSKNETKLRIYFKSVSWNVHIMQ
jgi:hypothetical protein